MGAALVRIGVARSVLVRDGELVDPGTLFYGKKVERLELAPGRDLNTLVAAVPAAGTLMIAVLKVDARTNSADAIRHLNQLGYAVEFKR